MNSPFATVQSGPWLPKGVRATGELILPGIRQLTSVRADGRTFWLGRGGGGEPGMRVSGSLALQTFSKSPNEMAPASHARPS